RVRAGAGSVRAAAEPGKGSDVESNAAYTLRPAVGAEFECKIAAKENLVTTHCMRLAAMKLRVGLIDDHPPFRKRLRALLEQDPNIEVVAEASSGQEILDIALKTEMDVACMDISMPGMDGI